MVSRPPAARRKPKASNEAPTYKSVMVALAQGVFFYKYAAGSDIFLNKYSPFMRAVLLLLTQRNYSPENFTNPVIACSTKRLPL